MLNMFFKRENQVEELIYSYLENLSAIEEAFQNAIMSCIASPACEEFDFLQSRTHKFESKADDIIEEINNIMYGKVLIPDSREDIMNLLHAMDQIPNCLEKVLFIIKFQQVAIPTEYIDPVKDLIRISMESCTLLIRQVKRFLKKESGIRRLMNTIDQNESRCDHIEHRLIEKIFKSDMDPFMKLQLKELVNYMGDISDHADRVSKLVNILSLKRRV